MANILTASEAALVLRVDETDQLMVSMLPQVTAFIVNASGREWGNDNPIRPEAKAAAQMLLVMWYENPAMIGNVNPMTFGLTAVLTQLEALALQLAAAEAAVVV